MEWIRKILIKHTDEDGMIDLEQANKEIDKQFPVNAVPKDQYNHIAKQLTETTEAFESVKNQMTEHPDVQKELTALQEKYARSIEENKEMRISLQTTQALRARNVKDLDYVLFKLGKLELGEDGQVKELEEKINELQASLPEHFSTEEHHNEKTTQTGYQIMDNKLPTGTASAAYDPFAEILAKYN
ncbi:MULTISPECIES: scaffolding protein [unclassified Enterococcus]|uniref:phage scaffolding protein n=1 Tax=unclassified Enterococcus TaxID=2608891 RepID=UPI0013EB5BC7|nr:MULTISPECIES: scaffolding protein [unclassified Enterococcus]